MRVSLRHEYGPGGRSQSHRSGTRANGSLGVFLLIAVLAACAKPPAAPPPAPAPQVEEPPAIEVPIEDRARQALELFEQKKLDEAIPALTSVANEYPEVAPFLRLRIAEAETERGNLQNAIALLSEIIAISDTSAAIVARPRLPALYAHLGDRASTDAAWQQAMQVPIDELTESDFVDMATALAKFGRTDLATSTRMHLLTTYTQGRYTEQTFDFVRGELEKLSSEEKVALAAKLARYDRYDQALTLLPADAPGARGTRLRALFNSRHYAELLAETKGVKLGDPSLMLLRARAAWRDDKAEEFLAGLVAVEKEFPASKEAIEAKVLRAKYYVTDEIDYARAIENLSKAIDAGALGNDGENLWNLGWTYALAGREDDALKTFDRYIQTYPDGDWKTNSLFWSAKILDRRGHTAERDAKAAQIVAEYPFSYYAYRAKELWGPSPGASRHPLPASGERGDAGRGPSPRERGEVARRADEGTQVFPDIESELAKLTEPRLNVVRELQSIGLHRAAAREMKLLATKYDDNLGVQFMLADVYVRGAEPFKANGVLQRRFRPFVRHGGANIPRRFWEILFPLAYWHDIRVEAEKRGHDPYLLASIIRQESGFEPTTVSNAGAVGLMQIMPAEAARIGEAAGLGTVTRTDLFDPRTNIAVGAMEYAQKLALMNDNPILAIAAYNAGEEAVRRWTQRTPPEDADLFIETIPYAETRLYVKIVTRNRHEYRRIYEGVATGVATGVAPASGRPSEAPAGGRRYTGRYTLASQLARPLTGEETIRHDRSGSPGG